MTENPSDLRSSARRRNLPNRKDAPLRHLLLWLLSASLLASGCAVGKAQTSDSSGPNSDKRANTLLTDERSAEFGARPSPLSGGDEAELPVTVPSADSTTVTVEDTSRIVSLRASISEVVYSLGLGPNVVGRDVSTTFDEARDVRVVTNGHDIAAEALLSLRPSVVLTDTDTGPKDAIAQLRAVGVPVVVFDPVTRIEDIGAHMRAVGAALGLDARADELARRTEAQLGESESHRDPDGERPRVAFLYLRGNAGVYLLGGPGSGADSMVDAAGGSDVGTALGLKRAFTPLTSEALVASAPEVLLLTTTGLESVGGIDGLLALPGVAQTPAGAKRSVITIEDGLLYSFGVRTPQTIKALADKLGALHSDAGSRSGSKSAPGSATPR